MPSKEYYWTWSVRLTTFCRTKRNKIIIVLTTWRCATSIRSDSFNSFSRLTYGARLALRQYEFADFCLFRTERINSSARSSWQSVHHITLSFFQSDYGWIKILLSGNFDLDQHAWSNKSSVTTSSYIDQLAEYQREQMFLTANIHTVQKT